MAVQPRPLNVHECKEYDEEVRDCVIILHTRPVDNYFVNNILEPADKVGVFGLPDLSKLLGSPDIYLHHWALVAYFKDGERLFTFEAIDKDGKIEVCRTVGAIDNPTKEFKVGMIRTSPKKLLLLAQKHSYNGTQYSALSKNCQAWVKEFARMISEQLAKAMEQFKTFEEANGILRVVLQAPQVLVAGATATAATGIQSSFNSLKNINYTRYSQFACDSFESSASGSGRSLNFNSLNSFGSGKLF